MNAPLTSHTLPRKTFLRWAALLGLAPVAVPAAAASSSSPTPWSPSLADPPGGRTAGGNRAPGAADFPQHDPARVQAVVGASHGDFERVRALVGEQPALAKSSWDWGFGDWETALGAAAHTGRREIALFLLEHGAPPTLFSSAMLGELDVVRAVLEADPARVEMDGPHGLSLFLHARAGGEGARPVLDWLLANFQEPVRSAVQGDEDTALRYGGEYLFEGDPPASLTVGVRNGFLLVGAGEQPNSRVYAGGPDTFHPTGARAVALRFSVEGGRAVTLTVENGPDTRSGRRISG